MFIAFVESRSGDLGRSLCALFLSFALLACNDVPEASIGKVPEAPASGQGPVCDAESVRVIESALKGSGLQESLLNKLSGANEKVVVVWGGIRPPSSKCPEVDGFYSVKSPGQVSHVMPDVYLIVTSMFRNDSAAYVQISVHPTATQGEFFLSKESDEWTVIDKVVWEE
jgi:hypothetical protein